MNKENIIDLSKLPAVEGKNIVNIIALNGAGEIIKADSDYITTESLAATIEPFVTDEELEREKKERINRQTVEVADKVVEKQMRIVQEIASLLGETAAETKIALTKLKESIGDE